MTGVQPQPDAHSSALSVCAAVFLQCPSVLPWSGCSQQHRSAPQSRPSQNQLIVEASEGAPVESTTRQATISRKNPNLRISLA